MPLGADGTYFGAAGIYLKQMPPGTTINGNTVKTEEVVDAGGLVNIVAGGLMAYKGLVLPGIVGFGIAKGAANICIITMTVQDNNGQAILNTPFDLDVIMSDAATGIGITATAPSTSATLTTGTTINTYVTNKAFYGQTNASGVIVLTITDTAKTGYYIMVQGGQLPIPYVSRQLLAADYGP